METWYECNGPLKRVILHARVDSFGVWSMSIEDLQHAVQNALDSFTAFTKREPRDMRGIRPTVWISRHLSEMCSGIGHGGLKEDTICGMPVHIASQYLPFDLTIEWRDEEFVNKHDLEAPRYRYTNYISSSALPKYRNLPLDYSKFVVDVDNGKGSEHIYISSGRGNGKSLMCLDALERKYCEADVKATEAAYRGFWSEFCGRGGYTKSHTIKKVIFNDPATIVYWTDGTKTVVKRQPGDKKFDPEKGLAMAYVKHELGLKEFNKLLENAEVHNEKKR